MNINAFIWLQKNLDRYEYRSEDAIKIKDEIASVELTDENIKNEEFVNNAGWLYERFISLFYNNALGYRKGLADKPITSKELDCYFISTNYGAFSIGSYRAATPETIKTVVDNYINSCKKSIAEEKYESSVKRYIDSANEKMKEVKKSGKPSAIRVIMGYVFSLALIAVSLILMSSLDVTDVLFGSCTMQEALEDIAGLYNVGDLGWIVAFVISIIGIIMAICGISKTIIETICLIKKSAAQNAIDKAIEANESFEDVDEIANNFIHSMTTGKYAVIKTEEEFSKEIALSLENAYEFASLTPKKRGGIGYAFISLLMVIAIVMILPYSEAVANVTEGAFAGYDEEYDEDEDDKKKETDDEEQDSRTEDDDIDEDKKDRNKKDKSDKKDEKSYEDEDEPEKEDENPDEDEDKSDKKDENPDEDEDEPEKEDEKSDKDEDKSDEKPEKPDKVKDEEAEETPKVSEYYVFKSDSTWIDASAHARNIGGYLVSINNRDEFDKVCALADQKGIKVFWVGAKRRSDIEWYEAFWQDGSRLVFTNWLQGEPTYYSEEGEEECYLMVFKVDGVWYYNDATYDVAKYYPGKIGYVIEIEE